LNKESMYISVKNILNTVKFIASILLIVWIYDNYQGKGILMLFGLAVVIVIIRLATNWTQYMNSMKYIETQIWGRPLDKIYGKPPKIKFKWRKND